MPPTRPKPKALAVRVIEARTRKPFPEIIAGRLAAGKSFRQIGEEFGMAHTTIMRHWRRCPEAQTKPGTARNERQGRTGSGAATP